MSFFQDIMSQFGYAKISPPAKGEIKRGSHRFSYSAANNNRLNADWRLASVGPNHDLRYALETVRNRARDLVNNDDYAKGYIRQMKVNVIGPFGFTPRFNPADRDQKFRENTKRIKEKFFTWCEAEHCTLSGEKEFLDVQNLAITYAARDGEFAIRIIRDKRLRFGFTLQMLQIELLDELYTEFLPGNRVVILGIEYDRSTWRKTAFYFRDIPMESQVYGYLTTIGKRIRIPAEEIIYGFDQEYENQTRGISWMVQTMSAMKMLSAYDEATLINARMRAMLGGFIDADKDANPQAIKGEEEEGDENVSWELENGMWKMLPPGYKASYADNDFPSAQLQMFRDQNLRKQSVGLGTAGSVHSGNYSDVNFSSERARQIAVRDNYMLTQEWMIRRFYRVIGRIFLKEAYLTGEITYPLAQFDRYAKIIWAGRRWAYVNPEQEWNANQIAWNMNAKSISQMIIEGDSPFEPEEVFQQCADDVKALSALGLQVVTDIKQPTVPVEESPDKKKEEPAHEDKDKEENTLKVAKKILTNGVHHD